MVLWVLIPIINKQKIKLFWNNTLDRQKYDEEGLENIILKKLSDYDFKNSKQKNKNESLKFVDIGDNSINWKKIRIK